MGFIIANHDKVFNSNQIKYIYVEYHEFDDTYRAYVYCDSGDDIFTIFECDRKNIPQDAIYKERTMLDANAPSVIHSDDNAVANMILRGLLDIWKKANSGETMYVPETFKDLVC